MIIPLKKIVIIGGGAGGLELATRLGHKLGRRQKADITLVDCNHIHFWKPLLHELAVGSLDESVDAISYMAHAHNHGYQFQLGTMYDIDRENKKILLDDIRDHHGKLLVAARRLYYDILVVALGSMSNDFGTEGVQEHCFFLDNPKQAQRFHNNMLNLFLKCSMQGTLGSKFVNIVIVGGGATGVELSAELHNAVQQLHSYGFKIDNKALNVTLIEAGERILPAMSPRISVAVHNELTKLGVRVITNTMVTSADAGGFYTKDSEYIQAELMVWAAGIKAPDYSHVGLEMNHLNQLVVKPTLQTTRDPFIFAIGDCASCMMPDGSLVPPRAQAAHQMAYHVHGNILAMLRDKPPKAYIYNDYGSLISLSSFNTIGSLMRNQMIIKGRIARAVYTSLYRIHQIALHGYIKTSLIILVGIINRIIRPHLKLH